MLKMGGEVILRTHLFNFFLVLGILGSTVVLTDSYYLAQNVATRNTTTKTEISRPTINIPPVRFLVGAGITVVGITGMWKSL